MLANAYCVRRGLSTEHNHGHHHQHNHGHEDDINVSTDVAKQAIVDTVKKYAYDSFLVGLWLPAETRSIFYAMHAFNIELAMAQTLARDNALAAQIRLQFWRDVVDAVYASPPKPVDRVPMGQALQFAAQSANVSKRWFDRVLDTREADILREDRTWKTLDEAETFCEGVYSSLLYATSDSVSGGCAYTETALSRIGTAHGLMNMLLGIPAAIAQGGYLGLPMSLFEKPLDPRSNSADRDDVISVVRSVCVEIDEHLQQARSLLPQVPKENRCLLLQVRSHNFVFMVKCLELSHHILTFSTFVYYTGCFSGIVSPPVRAQRI